MAQYSSPELEWEDFLILHYFPTCPLMMYILVNSPIKPEICHYAYFHYQLRDKPCCFLKMANQAWCWQHLLRFLPAAEKGRFPCCSYASQYSVAPSPCTAASLIQKLPQRKTQNFYNNTAQKILTQGTLPELLLYLKNHSSLDLSCVCPCCRSSHVWHSPAADPAERQDSKDKMVKNFKQGNSLANNRLSPMKSFALICDGIKNMAFA